MNPIVRLASWPIAVMLTINLSRTVADSRMAKAVRLGLLLLLLGAVWYQNQA